MKIGLLIAIERELAAFLESGEERTEETVAGKTIYKTRLEGHEVYAVQSGCGEIDAAADTMLLMADRLLKSGSINTSTYEKLARKYPIGE